MPNNLTDLNTKYASGSEGENIILFRAPEPRGTIRPQ